jgi:hypothetical protein
MPARFALGALVVSLCLFSMGCASKRLTQSGFLQDYSGFAPDPDGSGALLYKKPGMDLSKYTKVMIDPVVIWYSPEAEYQGIYPEEIKELADYFREEGITALKDAYPVVDEPGPGVLRIRTAMTDVVPTRSVVVTTSPGELRHQRPFPTADPESGRTHLIILGQAAIEAEFLDSETNERQAAYIDRSVRGTQPDGQRGNSWGAVKDAFRQWAKKLRQRLDEAHGKQ